MLRFCRKLQNRSFFVKPGNLLRRSLAPANASPFSVASSREQKTPNLLPSGFSGCLPCPCSDVAPSSREQKTPNPLPSGFGIGLPGPSGTLGSSRREQKTPNPLPSGFLGCLTGPCSDVAPSRREQKTPNPLPSGLPGTTRRRNGISRLWMWWRC